MIYLHYIISYADLRPRPPRPEPHTRHILPPSEIDVGLFRADFADLEGKHLFHRIG